MMRLTRVLRAAVAASSLLLCGGLTTSLPAANVIVNPGFDQGPDNLAGYEAFAVWSKGAAGFNSPWALADAPVVASGNGTAVFSMNTQLAAADPFWTGATQQMTFQQNFWTPDNNAGVTPTVDLYNQKLFFSGNAVVTQPYAAGNLGQAFIQFLDQSYNAVAFVPVDISTLDPVTGAFTLEADAPAGGLNIIQVGFRNSGIEGTAGQMTVSNLTLTAVPEPGTVSLGVIAVGMLAATRMLRRRRAAADQVAVTP